MASGAGVLIFVPQVGREVMHNLYALFLCSLMLVLTLPYGTPSRATSPPFTYTFSSFNLFLLHIFLPTSLAEDNELTLARYHIPSLTHLRNPHASQGYLLLTAYSLEVSSRLYLPPPLYLLDA